MKVNDTDIELVHGSVLEQEADAIVNAQNTKMRGGGGLNGAFHKAAGPELLKELEQVAPDGAPTGYAVVTGAHDIENAQHIIHVAGPVYDDGKNGEAIALSIAYQSCLSRADSLGLKSIAFPSLSTGIYGYPLSAAAPIAVKAVKNWLHSHPSTSLEKIVFTMFQQAEFEAFEEALED